MESYKWDSIGDVARTQVVAYSLNRGRPDELDAQIGGMAEKVVQMRQGLREEVVYRPLSIAPFNRMPNELLCEVGRHCINNGMKCFHLNQINSAVRCAINQCKTFWTSIFVTRNSEDYEVNEQHILNSTIINVI
jgi:hypothetical protein